MKDRQLYGVLFMFCSGSQQSINTFFLFGRRPFHIRKKCTNKMVTSNLKKKMPNVCAKIIKIYARTGNWGI